MLLSYSFFELTKHLPTQRHTNLNILFFKCIYFVQYEIGNRIEYHRKQLVIIRVNAGCRIQDKQDPQLEQVRDTEYDAEAHGATPPSRRAMECPATIPNETIQYSDAISRYVGHIIRETTYLEHNPNNQSGNERIPYSHDTELDSLSK